METIVSTNNLFFDTSRGLTADSKGDNHLINLSSAGITAANGQYIRLTLDNACIPKVFSDINANNSTFRLISTHSDSVGTTATVSVDVNLTHQNVTTINALASDFATKLAAQLETEAKKSVSPLSTITSTEVVNLVPDDRTTINGTTDNIIKFRVNFKNTSNALAPHNLSNVIVQFQLDSGDSYALLGGNRINDSADATTSSITIDDSNANYIDVTCLYPAQRTTTPYIYLRTDLLNTAIETLGLAHPSENYNNDTTHSDIFARIPVDTEFCQYTASTGREFFLNIHQKHISQIRLRITDNRNRPLGRPLNSVSKTATGTGTEQSTLGNLSFSGVIRIDVIQQRQVNEMDTTKLEPPVPARFAGVLTHQGFGRDDYGRRPGF